MVSSCFHPIVAVHFGLTEFMECFCSVARQLPIIRV